MNQALLILFTVALSAPAFATIAPVANGAGNETLERVSDLATTARDAANLEKAGQSLSRGYDLASAQTPAQSDGVGAKRLPSELTPPSPEPGGVHFTAIPKPEGAQIPADKQDEAAAKAAADAEKKKKDLQRMAIGGAAAGLVLAVFGFIFGGPVGALVMGSIGFGVYAGITYLNNNPI